MGHRLNLARRPFVNARPSTLAAAALTLLVLVLSVVSVRTLARYLAGSRRTRLVIASLKTEISSLEEARRRGEARLARFDLATLEASASDANAIALRRSFSWTRFLSRLEKTLPYDVRVSAISLSRGERSEAGRPVPSEVIPVELVLISREPDGLPRAIRAFYGSPWFDRPTPQSEERAERGAPEGHRLTLSVLYRDEGSK